MKLRQDQRSPNFDGQPITVEFVVLHYTALSLPGALDLLCNSQSKLSAHLVISEQGEVFELVPCLKGEALRAWHAGESRCIIEHKTWSKFNDFSIGIELENLNGNIFAYPTAQLDALYEVLALLRERYPALQQPERIIGHEQIAGFRGKCDPGIRFNWPKLYSTLYPDIPVSTRAAVLDIWWGRAVCFCLRLMPKGLVHWDKLSCLFERIAARASR